MNFGAVQSTDERSDLLLDGSRGDGLVERPFDGFGEPGVAGESDFAGSGVDAGDEFVGDADGHLLHTSMVANLITDNTSDNMSGMTIDSENLLAKASEHAHEFAQQQHVKTFAKLAAVERIARREDYTDLYDLMTDLRAVLDA